MIKSTKAKAGITASTAALAFAGTVLCVALLTGCSSGGSGGSDEEEEEPIVTVQNCLENCGDIANGETPRVLSLDAPISVSVLQGEKRVFEVPSGAEVSVLSTSGEVELLLYDELEDINLNGLYGQNNHLCRSTGWRVIEDNCRAVSTDEDVYAVIDSFYADSTFTITATNDCSVEAINRWVYRNMQDYYLYADQVPVVNTDSYSSASDLVRALRFEEQDPFSFATDAVSYSRYLEAGESFGFGHGWAYDRDGQLRLQFVYDDSPLGRAGFNRGDIVVTVNGESIAEMTNERFDSIFGDVEEPVNTEWVIVKGDTGERRTATVRMAVYRINTVLSADTVYTNTAATGTIPYVAFKGFLETSEAELDQVISNISTLNPTDLVLDLRYNGGGRGDVGVRLASQIGGVELADELYTTDRFNDTYTHLDYSSEFIAALPSLDLDRLLVLTSDRTASASERLISGLRPYMEVITFGTKTRGKPFGSFSKKYCGMSLNAMDTHGYNAAGVSVLGGIEADCWAEDDITRDFASGASRSEPTEAMLDTALNYAFFGTCLAPPITKNTTENNKALTSPPLTYEQTIHQTIH